MLTLDEVVALTQGRLAGPGGRAPDASLGARTIDGISTDTRSIADGSLFVALAGDRFDGHAFVDDVAARGARAVLVERPGAALPAVVVDDTRRALGDLAAGWRGRFDLPLVAVTGSNGKTTTKEMIAAILAAAYGADDRLATRGNLNNDIGVPLTLLGLRTHHRAAVVELGMNHPGETARLAQIAGPTVALVVNAQREHQEFMQSVAAVAAEHALAIAGLPEDGVAVFPADDHHAAVWRLAAGSRRVVDFACASSDDRAADAIDESGSAIIVGRACLDVDETVLHLSLHDEAVTVRLAVPGLHNAHNATAAAAAAFAAGIPTAAIRDGLVAFRPLDGRSQRLTIDGGTTIVDDSYNANPDSMRAAIDLLAARAAPRLLVMGDMGEVGDDGPRYHAEVGHYARECGVETLYATGAASRTTVTAFGAAGRHFDAMDPLIAAVAGWVASSAAPRSIVVKGSRFMRMERVVDALAGRTGAH